MAAAAANMWQAWFIWYPLKIVFIILYVY